ncbi:MAG TPA: DNA translocase FtsK 4TM domain-containing protein [Caulobacteraceae bacterium]|jgi:S-DNA-T family DNA segregation ATPase FtsK/SpoIIIE|nr:DNA translocase FtsK 4TM domain-containing protein [Caulobacteraceae bacterium]
MARTAAIRFTPPAQLGRRIRGGALTLIAAAWMAALISYHAGDASLDSSAAGAASNLMGAAGADAADLSIQLLGLGAAIAAALLLMVGLRGALARAPEAGWKLNLARLVSGLLGVSALVGALAAPPTPLHWPLAAGLGGVAGAALLALTKQLLTQANAPHPLTLAAVGLAGLGAAFAAMAVAPPRLTLRLSIPWPRRRKKPDMTTPAVRLDSAERPRSARSVEPGAPGSDFAVKLDDETGETVAERPLSIRPPKTSARGSGRAERELQPTLPFAEPGFRLPELVLLAKPKVRASAVDEEALRANAHRLEGVLGEFGVRGVIDNIRPGPVVTLYELAPAAGVKSARVVALSDDIARSMSVEACRVSVVPGRNAIGIELPNHVRETVFLRDLLASAEYEKSGQTLPLALGETIGGEPYIADLARMPHLLIAGTTGSGKSVGVNAMILSILYRLPPEKCRFIMIDPKMLELSVYDGIPHLLAPVVTEPKKAIVALKWTVREMEDRYRRMSKIGVRNVAGYNERAIEAQKKGEHFVRTVQTGFDEKGRPIFEEEKLRPEPMPYLVVVIDEVADLMMVAGKDIEGAVQRLAQMARAAGIHLIMATQRPSVDVITGTIKANFPTRISFQVTSKIDARTILGEQGAEQLLGQGDMLYMAGGGRVTRLHGPFVSDQEVETVAKFLRDQGEPDYLDDVTAAPDEEGSDGSAPGEEAGSNDLYDQAVAVVTRDRKASTSYIQRRLQIGYNRAASLMERMEREGVVGAANHAGKRDILAAPPP